MVPVLLLVGLSTLSTRRLARQTSTGRSEIGRALETMCKNRARYKREKYVKNSLGNTFQHFRV